MCVCVCAVLTPAAEASPAKRIKVEESFQLSVQQRQLIQEDTANRKLWDEAMVSLAEGQVCAPSSMLLWQRQLYLYSTFYTQGRLKVLINIVIQ